MNAYLVMILTFWLGALHGSFKEDKSNKPYNLSEMKEELKKISAEQQEKIISQEAQNSIQVSEMTPEKWAEMFILFQQHRKNLPKK